MKSLKEYVKESILDDIDVQMENTDRILVEKFIRDNYNLYHAKEDKKFVTVSDVPNKDGMYEASTECHVYLNGDHNKYLTNGMFVWKYVGGWFTCSQCKGVISLEGSPREVNGYFSCRDCPKLKSLKGGPEKVKGYFDCFNCESLESLEGCPKIVTQKFDCGNCTSLKSLKGVPKSLSTFYCNNCTSLKSLKGGPEKLRMEFDCSGCTSLDSLEGCPKNVRHKFKCDGCAVKFTEDDVMELCNVGDEIIC